MILPPFASLLEQQVIFAPVLCNKMKKVDTPKTPVTMTGSLWIVYVVVFIFLMLPIFLAISIYLNHNFFKAMIPFCVALRVLSWAKCNFNSR